MQTVIDTTILKGLTLQELLDLRSNIDEAIAERPASEEISPDVPPTPTYELSWDSGVCDTRKWKKPFIARITGVVDGKLDREFVELPTSYGAKNSVQVAGTFTAQEGDIFEAREGGSWKNEYRYFYVVENGQLRNFGDATRAGHKMNVIQYLLGKMTLAELVK